MVPAPLLSMLRCPEDHSSFAQADETLVARLNEAVREGRLRNRAGRRVERRLDSGLIRAAGDLLYPIVDQIPILLADEAIPIGESRVESPEPRAPESHLPALDSRPGGSPT